MNHRTLVGAVVAAAVVLISTSVWAKPTNGPADVSKTDDGMLYDFRDADSLTAGSRGPAGGVIKVRNRTMRRTLIRPRANFVPELLKSVEQI